MHFKTEISSDEVQIADYIADALPDSLQAVMEPQHGVQRFCFGSSVFYELHPGSVGPNCYKAILIVAIGTKFNPARRQALSRVFMNFEALGNRLH